MVRGICARYLIYESPSPSCQKFEGTEIGFVQKCTSLICRALCSLILRIKMYFWFWESVFFFLLFGYANIISTCIDARQKVEWFVVFWVSNEGRPRFYGNSKFGTCQPMELAVILALIKCEIATGAMDGVCYNSLLGVFLSLAPRERCVISRIGLFFCELGVFTEPQFPYFGGKSFIHRYLTSYRA